MAGRRTFRILTSSQQSGNLSKDSNTDIVQQIHIRWQHHTQDILKKQHVEKVKNTKKGKQHQPYRSIDVEIIGWKSFIPLCKMFLLLDLLIRDSRCIIRFFEKKFHVKFHTIRKSFSWWYCVTKWQTEGWTWTSHKDHFFTLIIWSKKFSSYLTQTTLHALITNSSLLTLFRETTVENRNTHNNNTALLEWTAFMRVLKLRKTTI